MNSILKAILYLLALIAPHIYALWAIPGVNGKFLYIVLFLLPFFIPGYIKIIKKVN